MTYESQLAFKQQQVKNNDDESRKCQNWSASNAWNGSALGYRNKAQIPVRTVVCWWRVLQEELAWLNLMEDFPYSRPKNWPLNCGRSWYFKKVSVVAYDEANNTGDEAYYRATACMQAEWWLFLWREQRCCHKRKAIVEHYSGASRIVYRTSSQPKPTNVGRETKVSGRCVWKSFKFCSRSPRIRSSKWIPYKPKCSINMPLTLRTWRGGETVVDACGIGTMVAFAHVRRKSYAIKIVDDTSDCDGQGKCETERRDECALWNEGGTRRYLLTLEGRRHQPDVIVVDPPHQRDSALHLSSSMWNLRTYRVCEL